MLNKICSLVIIQKYVTKTRYLIDLLYLYKNNLIFIIIDSHYHLYIYPHDYVNKFHFHCVILETNIFI